MPDKDDDTTYVRRAITIKRSPDDVAAFWLEHAGAGAAHDEMIRFIPAPGGRGTEVHLDRAYRSPGRIASALAMFRHEHPTQQAFDELFALKQVLETGDIVRSDAWANDSGERHPAQPDANPSGRTATSRTNTPEAGLEAR
jgi:uncharacterized membrane protein